MPLADNDEDEDTVGVNDNAAHLFTPAYILVTVLFRRVPVKNKSVLPFVDMSYGGDLSLELTGSGDAAPRVECLCVPENEDKDQSADVNVNQPELVVEGGKIYKPRPLVLCNISPHKLI